MMHSNSPMHHLIGSFSHAVERNSSLEKGVPEEKEKIREIN